MIDILFLALRYLLYHRVKTAVLVGSITIIAYVPSGLNVLLEESGRQLTARAKDTPLVIGAKGSPLELVLNSLYFKADVPVTMRYGELQRVRANRLAEAIPLSVRFRTRHGPIVGTTLDYFTLRNLRLAEGRQMAMLGECVLGARAAGARPGDSILSTPENVFDIAGVYPLKMQVAGVLQPTGSPDDEAVVVDIKTTWVIEGLGHGHEDLTKAGASAGVLRREGSTIVANASVLQYNEITPENVGSFHFHGQLEDFPITAVIALPHDEKSGTLLEGRYLAAEELVQILRPGRVIEDLLETVFTIRSYLVAAILIVGISTLATMLLVFVLSVQLRWREIETMSKIGGSPLRILGVLATEILAVLLLGFVLARCLTLLTTLLAGDAARLLVQLS